MFLKISELRSWYFSEIEKSTFSEDANNDIQKKDNKIYAVGGRVLNFVSLSKNFKTAREKIFSNLNKLNWKNGFYRKDIGYKVIDKWE